MVLGLHAPLSLGRFSPSPLVKLDSKMKESSGCFHSAKTHGQFALLI